MSDERLRRAFESLPRARARGGFTERVLARLDEREGHRRGRFPRRVALHPRAAWAAVAVVLALVGTLVAMRAPRAAAPAAEQPGAVAEVASEVEELARTHAALAAELEALRELAAPEIYVDGDEDFELVLDVLSADAAGPREGALRPAASARPARRARPAASRGFD